MRGTADDGGAAGAGGGSIRASSARTWRASANAAASPRRIHHPATTTAAACAAIMLPPPWALVSAAADRCADAPCPLPPARDCAAENTRCRASWIQASQAVTVPSPRSRAVPA
ncbi:hypothetical protein ACFQXA_31435 [Nocardiopsis composta]